MISWIVASHDPTILLSNLAASMLDPGDDEVVLIDDAPSIAAAYNQGQARAKHRIRCYVHHDVAFLDLPRLRTELVAAVDGAGMVGLIGSRTPALPWWDGDVLGSVFDSRIGLLDFGPGGPCAVLDGLLLATVHDVAWDETIPGWHGYDYDACMQLRGLTNVCLTGGGQMVRHNTTNPSDPRVLTGWDETLRLLREKWGGP